MGYMGVGGCHISKLKLMSNGEGGTMEKWSSPYTMQTVEQCLHSADSGAVLTQCIRWSSACTVEAVGQFLHSADSGTMLGQYRQWNWRHSGRTVVGEA